MTRFLSRIAGASLLDAATYEDVEADRSATTQAMVVVFLSSIAAGVGALGSAATHPAALVTISVLAFVVWAVWAVLTFEIGSRLMPSPRTQADLGQLLRTIGFASAPGMIRVLGIVPGIMTPVFFISAVWMLFAMIVGVRQALEYTSTLRAATVCSISWLLSIGLAYAAGALFVPALY
jgi:hypothetical protein